MNKQRCTTTQLSLGLLGAIIGLILFSGCAVGPEYQPPSVDIPAHWSEQPSSATGERTSASEQDLVSWWVVFHDPLLTSLEERALATNLDLKLAEARIQQARAARLGASSTLGPTLEGTTQYRHSQSPINASQNGNGGGTIGNQFQAGFDASWEIDIFGRGRRTVEAADADLLAAAEASHSAMVSLTAEVARTYLELRALQQSIQTARQNISAQEQMVEIIRQLFEAGFKSSLDLAAAEAQTANMQAQVPPFEQSSQQTMHSLSILLGREPTALMAELTLATPLPAHLPSVTAGIPADLLRRRPDIRRAEAQIHASTARIGIAEADLFPKLTLSGALNLQGGALDSWFNWTNRLWSLGPSVSWQLFDSGRVKANVLQQKSLQEQSLIIYQQTVLIALQEVEDTLIATAKEQEHNSALAQAREANRKTLELAKTLYNAGQTDFISVLMAERVVFVSDDLLIQSTKTLATNLVALYKALGGGWDNAAQ